MTKPSNRLTPAMVRDITDRLKARHTPPDPRSYVTVRSATAHGWLRRPELDTRCTQAWEKPDGTLYAAEVGQEPLVASFPPFRFFDRSGGPA